MNIFFFFLNLNDKTVCKRKTDCKLKCKHKETQSAPLLFLFQLNITFYPKKKKSTAYLVIIYCILFSINWTVLKI